MAEMSLLDILDDENYLNANSATKEAIFNKYAPLDPNYTGANDDTKEAIRKRFGVSPLRPVEKPPEEPKDTFPTLRAAADVPLSFARGATTGVKMISDFFGADNPVSQNLIGVESYLADLMSAQSKKDAQEISRIMADAQDKGVLEQVKAGIKAFSVAPVDILTNAFGTAAPTIVAGLAASTIGAPATATAGLLTAGRVAAGAVGAISGAGTIKGVIYNDVKQALLEQDVPEDVAEEAAVRAQSYNGENLDSILTGGLIGTIASVTGLEPSATKGILSRIITGSAAKEAVEQTGQQAAKSSFVRGAVSELVPEAAQAGQEQLASNIALQREGMDVPTMRGVAGAAALEGIAGGILGGVARKLEGGGERPPAKAEEDAALLEALNVFNQKRESAGLKPVALLEDVPGNTVLAFANQNRDKIPVLGQILDSNIPRDIKIEQIRKRQAEIPQDIPSPTQTAIEGRVALPAPPAEGVLTSAPEAFSTAMKSNVPLTNLSVSQGPEGYRVVNDQGQVITQQVRTEREANLVLESLRREQDARNTGVYQQNLKAYEQERLPVITEAVARAAREVQTPITSFPMADVKAVDEGTYNAIRELRKGRNLKADVTPAELERLNVSPAVMSELTLKQKPVTGGGATIRPEYEQEILGPRPSEPVRTARTAEQLRQSTEKVPGKIGRKKVMFAPSLAGAEVTQTQPLSQFEQPDMVTLYRSSGMADPSSNFERWTTDRKVAERFGPVNTVSIPRRDVERFSAVYANAPKTDVVFDRRGRTPTEIAKQMPVSQQGIEQEYSIAEDEARATKQQKKIKNLLKPEKGEAPPAGFRPAVGKQPRVERGTYPEIKGEAPPSAEAVAEAEKVINDRIGRIEKQGKQGEKIAQALRDALDSGDFTPPQMMIAFESASITARLLGATSAAPHDFKFANRIIQTSSGSAYGVRRLPITTNVNGMIELATIPEIMIKGRNTAAHEAFHVLQDLFNEYDKGAARIIRDAFSGALTVDNINPTLLNKLRSMVDPDTGKTYDVLVKENIKDYYDNASPQKRERELQAYVFAALDDARSKGVPVGNLGGAFVRFLNFYRAFKERLGNYLNGQGFQNVVDVFERVSTGEQQRGLGTAEKASGFGVVQRGKFEPEDLSRSGVRLPKIPPEEDVYKRYKRNIEFVPISWLKKIPGNAIRSQENVRVYAKSIAEKGIEDPLILNVGKNTRTAELGEGNHRLAALEQAGFTHAPVRVVMGQEYGSRKQGSGVVKDDLIPKAGEYFKADAAPSEVFKSLSNGEALPLTSAGLEEDLSRAAEQTGENVAEFKKWWKNSKAVDENGNPKRYYHGTKSAFRKFSGGSAYFFSPDPDFANKFSGITRNYEYSPDVIYTSPRNVIPAFLSVQDPFDYQNTRHIERVLKEVDLDEVTLNGLRYGDWNAIESNEVQDALRLAGFDGFYVREGGQKNLAVYEPSQIKSVFNRFDEGAATSEDFSRAEVPLIDKVPGLKAIWPHLTPDEREGLVTTSAKNLVKLFREMPSPQEMASVAYSGRAKRGWYINSARALVKIFGTIDSRRFAALLAATSPQTSVESNLVNALNIWSNWVKAGRPTDNSSILRIMGNSVQGDKGEESILDAWKNNTLRALATPDSELNNIQISGPKVDSFMRNLLGVVEEVTNDAWMANYSGVKQEVFRGRKSGEDAFGNVYTKSSGYISMSVAARKAADILTRTTGNKWTPAEIQETVWSWAKALYEMRASKGEGRTTRDILTQGSLTGDIINSVPDFEKLFVEGVYRQILEGSGYAKQIRKLGRDVASRSAGAAGNLGGVSALESQGSGFAEDAFRRNLFRAARRIEQLYQTRLERGETDVSEDLSLAEDPVLQPRELDDVSLAAQEEIQAGGLAPGLAGNANTYNKTFDSVREFFNPFALVTNSKMLFQFRNRTYGKISISEERARKTSDIIGKATPEDRKATYTYLTTRDGNPNTIKDAKVRAAAMTAKKEINKVGQELVDNKFMTQESYDKFYDQYLPRIYLYHELTGRGMTTPLGGVSKMEYVMKRKELSPEERKLLGEIKDPAFLTYVAMARPARDLAVSEYLNNLLSYSEAGGSNTPWVLPRSTVKWNGHNMTPYALLSEANDIRQFVLPVARANDPQQARSILANINKMEKIARDKITEMGVDGPSFDPNKYQKMPEDKRYGHLAGAVVQKGIYNDLVGTFIPVRVENRPILDRVFGDENSSLGKAVGLWKLGKTTLNVPTQVRNAVSNMIALTLFTDIPIYRIPGLMKRALTEITKDTQNWKDAQEYGIKGGTQSSAELRGIFERTLQRIRKYDDNKTKDNPLIHAIGSARIAGTTIVEKAGDVYQEVEVLFKFMAFLNERQKQNFVRKPSLISEAVDTANEALFDYTLVNPNVRWLRNAPIGLPFLTYFYKVVPKLIETAYKHPMRFAPYIALATALPLYTMAELDLTPDELEAMRKSLSDNIRNNGSLFFLPYRDEQGNIAYVDLAQFLPWAMITNPLIKAVYYGDVKGGGLEALRPLNPFESSPISTAIAALATGIDNFTGKPIADPRDTPTAQGLSYVSYVWNQAMPPMFSINLNDMDQSSGAIARVYNSLTDSGTDVTKRGLPKPDDVLTAARLLGFNAEPLKADMQRAANMNYMVSQIRKRESYRAEISKNQAMTPEKRRAKIQELNDQIREDYKKLQEYGAETALAAGVASRQRKLAKEEEQ